MRRLLILQNERGDILRQNIIETTKKRIKLINEWHKLYGKKFYNLTIKEIHKPYGSMRKK